MGAKRALIVDDSKSARLFLARMLEKYEIDVDSAESAEAAIDYLASNRPDVIFMDHLMPGMDGLQAVQTIKNNPLTATIPILMYTSQEGELYLGQARALGAVGVLPKQIKPTDVSKVLYQLHLVPDRRTSEQSTFTPLNLRIESGEPGLVGTKALTETTLREHFAELRRALVAGIDTQTDRITAEVRALLLESLPPPAPTASEPPAPSAWPWVIACGALAVALLSSALWLRSERQLEQLSEQVSALRVSPAPRALVPPPGTAPAAAPAAAAAASEAPPIILPVPYGAEALGGARLDALRQVLYRLERQKATGVVEVKSFAGRFCLVGNAQDGYSPAPEELPYAKCDVLGNPSDDALSVLQRTPLALANLLGDVRSSTHGTLQVQVASGDPANVLVPYPQPVPELTAGEWNRAASANNRVEIRVH
jgi:CheY-like chemotaxis protein